MTILNFDCREGMGLYPADYFDSLVTDPPYELGFMGKGWDSTGIANDVSVWRAALRVLKPGGHLLAFSGTRTYHRMVCAIEDAGFEIRDQIGWVYGSGFPKSLDVSKAIDKAAGAEREIVGVSPNWRESKRDREKHGSMEVRGENAGLLSGPPVTDAARQWQGWGTALKPAWEPIVLARKPLVGTVSSNVLQHGTGALNIDGCRVATDEKLGGGASSDDWRRVDSNEGWKRPWMEDPSAVAAHAERIRANVQKAEALGRWPANICHDGSDEVLAAFPQTAPSRQGKPRSSAKPGEGWGMTQTGAEYSDEGSAARFFYCAKASKRDREIDNHHPTVKPTELMRYLCRLITPPGGLILDPFAGSGSTGKAAALEGFGFIGFELEATYVAIANQRIMNTRA